MIIVRIWEGLGNQLFQYAYARALQERVKTEVYLDMGHCNRGDLPFEREDIVKRRPGLWHFNISMKGVNTQKIPALRCLEGRNMADRARYLLMEKKVGRWTVLEDAERMTEICPGIMAPGDYKYINAHCLNKGYYENCREVLLRELEPKEEPILPGPLEEAMQERNTVSLHIRLRD